MTISYLILHSNNMLVVWLVVILAVTIHAGKAIKVIVYVSRTFVTNPNQHLLVA